jgi:hypothetical protein
MKSAWTNAPDGTLIARASRGVRKPDRAKWRVRPSESISPSAQVMSIKADESRITSRVFTARALRDGSQDGYVNLLMQPFMNGISRARICLTMGFPREIGCFRQVGASWFEFTRQL